MEGGGSYVGEGGTRSHTLQLVALGAVTVYFK